MQAEWFGPYRLEELIGRGGMGEVFRATDTARKRVVALKRLPASLAADPSYQRRFRSESEIAAQLRSTHVIPIHDYGEIDGQLYIDMRLVNGEDVADRLNRSGPMSAQAAVDVIRQTASALDARWRSRPSNTAPTATDLAGASTSQALEWADAAFRDSNDKRPALKTEKPEQVNTLTGKPAVIVKVDATAAHTSGTCGTKGAVYAISATGFTGELGPTAILIVAAGVGFNRAIPRGGNQANPHNTQTREVAPGRIPVRSTRSRLSLSRNQ